MDKFSKGFEAYLDLPSPERRGHIRRFQRLYWLTDEQDVALRGLVAWKRWNWHAMAERDQKPSELLAGWGDASPGVTLGGFAEQPLD